MNVYFPRSRGAAHIPSFAIHLAFTGSRAANVAALGGASNFYVMQSSVEWPRQQGLEAAS